MKPIGEVSAGTGMKAKPSQPVDLTVVYQEVANFIASVPTSEQIAGFWLSARSEKLVGDLMKARRTRGLTPAEQAAYDEYVRIEALMLELKAKAFANLGQPPQSLA